MTKKVDITCAHCKKIFKQDAWYINWKKEYNQTTFYCMKCHGKWGKK